MRGLAKFVLAAAMVANAAAQPQHNHQQRHRVGRRHDHLHAQKRDVATVIETVYIDEDDGSVIPDDEAEAGLKDGYYVAVGTSTPTPTSLGAQFYEKSSSTQSTTSTSLSSTSTTPAPSSTSEAVAALSLSVSIGIDIGGSSGSGSGSGSSSGSAGSRIDEDFPDGELDCTFENLIPYGAVAAPGVKLAGFSSIYPGITSLTSMLVGDIVMGDNTDCKENSVCSYACQAGYQKSQWPEKCQGVKGQTVGGLYCSGGKLRLTRPDHPKICESGQGGVYVKSELDHGVALCRTDYPGSESMVDGLWVEPGNTYPVTNPLNTYFMWQGKTTTAQYYVNPEGVSLENACTWKSPTNPDDAGNWAPTNVGVGQTVDGTTFLSIFANKPTSDAILQFDIEITGDVNSECYLKNGEYSIPDGCTTGLPKGGTATIVFKKRGSS